MEKIDSAANESVPNQILILVSKLTGTIIEETIRAFESDDPYWVKFYHLISEIDSNALNAPMSYLKNNCIERLIY